VNGSKDPRTMTLEEVRDELITLQNSLFDRGYASSAAVLKAVFDARIAEMQTNAAGAQAAATQQMVAPTRARGAGLASRDRGPR
jgi:hypothetical protein